MKQEDRKFEASLGYKVRPCLQGREKERKEGRKEKKEEGRERKEMGSNLKWKCQAKV
jgi:hypothetical protein